MQVSHLEMANRNAAAASQQRHHGPGHRQVFGYLVGDYVPGAFNTQEQTFESKGGVEGAQNTGDDIMAPFC